MIILDFKKYSPVIESVQELAGYGSWCHDLVDW